MGDRLTCSGLVFFRLRSSRRRLRFRREKRRRLRLAVDTLQAGQSLRVSVACVHAGSQLLSFEGEVRAAEGEVLAEARFNVYMADNPGEAIK